MIDFSNVRNIITPKGEVSVIVRGAEILWQKQKYKRELLYLESTGKQAIDTGIVVTGDSIVKARTAFTTNPAGTSTEQINGVSSNGRCAWGYARSITNQYFYIGLKAVNINTGVPLDDLPHTFVISMDGNWSIDEHTGYQNAGTALPSLSVWLFARHRSQGDINTPCKEKLYFCQIYEGDTLVRDFIPVLDMNDVPCMYDKVSGKLFYNQGTGEFAYGELPSDDVRLPVEYQEVEYIESTGTQYIDTGFVPNQDTRVVTEHFYTKQPQNRGFIYGAGVSATDRTFELYTWGSNWNSPYGNTNIVMTPQISLFISGKINIDKNKNNITIMYSDGTSQTRSCEYVTFTAPRTMWLFAINRGSTSVDFRADCVQLCSCKIFENDTLVRDFIPCYRKSDNKPGMYDLVTKTFFTNKGTGEFLYQS